MYKNLIQQFNGESRWFFCFVRNDNDSEPLVRFILEDRAYRTDPRDYPGNLEDIECGRVSQYERMIPIRCNADWDPKDEFFETLRTYIMQEHPETAFLMVEATPYTMFTALKGMIEGGRSAARELRKVIEKVAEKTKISPEDLTSIEQEIFREAQQKIWEEGLSDP